MKKLYKIILLLLVNLATISFLHAQEDFSEGDQVTRTFAIRLNGSEIKAGDTIYFEKPDTVISLTIVSGTTQTIVFETIPFASISGASIFQINTSIKDKIESFTSGVFSIQVKTGSNHGIGVLHFANGNAVNKSTYDGIVLNFDGKKRNPYVPPVIPPIVPPVIPGCHQLDSNPIYSSTLNNCSGAPIRVISQIVGGNNYFSLASDTMYIPVKASKDITYAYSHALGYKDSATIAYTATGDSIATKHGTVKIYKEATFTGGYCGSSHSINLSITSDSTTKAILITRGTIKPDINLLKGIDVSSLRDSSLLGGSTYYFKMGKNASYGITRLGSTGLFINSSYSITAIHYSGNTFMLDTSFNIIVSTATGFPIQAPTIGISNAKAGKVVNNSAVMSFTSGNGNAASFWIQEGSEPPVPVSGESRSGGYLQDRAANSNVVVTLKQLKPSTTYYVTIAAYNYSINSCEVYYHYNTTSIKSFSFKTTDKEDSGLSSPIDLIISNTQPGVSGKFKNVTIATGGVATLSNDLLSSETLTVKSGGVLDLHGYSVTAGKIIIQDGGIVLETNTTGATGFGNSVEVDRAARTSAYRYLATPVGTGSVSSAVISYSYNEGGPPRIKGNYKTGWEELSGSMVRGVGYADFSPGTISNADFKGIINNGTISVNVTHTAIDGDDAIDGWNLLGNPYPSPVSVSSFLSGNSSVLYASGVYFWNGSNYTTMNTNNIPVAQGFFVHAQSNGSVAFQNSMRTTGLNTLYRTAETAQKINLNLSSSLNQDHLQIELRDTASDGFEPALDALKLRVSTANEFYAITATDKKQVAINILSDDGKDKTIPLGLHVAEAGTFSLSLGDNSLAHYTEIMLKDLTTGTLVDLSHAPYSFTASQSSDLRLELLLSNSVTTGVVNPATNPIVIGTAPGSILIKSSGKEMQIRVTDMMGKVHYEGVSTSNAFSIPVMGNNLYIVQAQTAEAINVQKVIVY